MSLECFERIVGKILQPRRKSVRKHRCNHHIITVAYVPFASTPSFTRDTCYRAQEGKRKKRKKEQIRSGWVHTHTCSGCSSCIICLSDTRSHWLGCESPVSDSLIPISSFTCSCASAWQKTQSQANHEKGNRKLHDFGEPTCYVSGVEDKY